MELESTNNGPNAKLPILKLGEYEMWAIRIKQYFQIQDYALWEVIENGDSWVPVSQTSEENGITVTKMSTPVTAEEKTNKKNDVKARANQENLKTLSLKLHMKNFSAASAESLDSIFNRLQKITNNANTASSQVSVANPSVNTASPQVYTASVSDNTMYAFMVENLNGSNVLHQDLEQIHEDDLEAIDLKWQLSLLNVRAKKYYQRTDKKIFINGNDIAGYDKSKVECYNCHKKQGNNEDTSKAMLAIDGVGFDWSDMAEELVQTNMALMAFSDSEVYTDKTCSKTCLKNYETFKKQYDDLLAKQHQTKFKAITYKRGLDTVEAQLVTYRKNEICLDEFKEPEFKGYGPENSKKESNIAKESDNSKENSDKSLVKELESQVKSRFVKGCRCNTSKRVSEVEPKKVRENNDAPIIEAWVSDDKEQDESITKPEKKIVTPIAAKIEKPVRKSVRYAEMYRSQRPRRNQRNWNGQKSNQLGSKFVMYNKACFNCGSFNHVQKNCTYHQKKKVVSENNYKRVDNDYYAKTSHHRTHKNMTPRVVLLRTGLIPLSTAKSVYTAHPKPTVHCARPKTHFYKLAQSTVQRPFYKNPALTNRHFNHKVNTVRPRIVNTARSYRTTINTVRPKVVNTTRPIRTSVNAARANGFNVVKPSACWVWRPIKPNSASITLNIYNYIDGKPQLDDKGFVDSGCSRHMTDTECLVLSPNFKLPDENQILLKIPRKDNMYSFDMKNIVPKESLTCLVAKATLDESMLWHRRLGHINFKNINKLVKDNLVRGLPTKRFENDQTCVACLKGKQHRASCKSKVLNPITKPLFMLHMDLFGPTFVSSLMHKKYCLVVTDDYSRFTWVFFLTTKDETSEILKRFIKEIENLVDKKVKIIRSDNGTEFKNKVMDDFCREKGIKREYSVARTPQQNGVAERRNRTLIEAARTMLADSKLPTTFWAEAVSTACYVQNRVLVVKPHNKTPYELFRGFKPALSFMRPFGCHVTILNTLDSLGKFDGKSDEGFFVGYSLSSKAFRVYNTRTKRVEENLHIGFLENKPMIEGTGPKWLFDIDFLTQSMNYVPVSAGTVSNVSAVESSEDQESLGVPEDASKQGRSIEDIDADVDVSLVDETQERQDDYLIFDYEVLEVDVMHVEAKVDGKDDQSKKLDDSTVGEAVTTAGIDDSARIDDSVVPTTSEEITLAQTLIQIKAAKPKVVTTAAATTTTTRLKDRGVVV
ncbi:putative ribonuclease H-like domain-containing protein [Tanacetum coccineum]